MFEGTGFLYTLFVEFGYLLLLFSLVELVPSIKIKKVLFVTINLVCSILLLAILIYHDYFGYIVTVHVFSQIGQVGTVKDSVLQLFDPIYAILFVDFLIVTIYSLFRRESLSLDSKSISKRWVVPVMLIGAVLIGYNIFTLKNVEIASTVLAAEKQGILTYELLAMKDTFIKEPTVAFTEEEQLDLPDKINEIKGIDPLPAVDLKLKGIAEGKNIIVIQAEAFQDFTLNLEVEGKEITPFLNELLEESLYFPNVYQQIGPGNTSDAEFLFNTSLYPSAWTATSESFGNRDIPSFPKLLKERGYQTMTFHANDVTFWNRNKMYPALGFDQYYDIKFFGEEDVIGIGPSDEHVYENAVPKLKELYDKEQPFYAQFVTLSSHHPFQIPSDKEVIELPGRFEGTLVGDYLEAINYTDTALKQLVEDLKAQGMWEDTIFVLYGDHFGLQPSGLKEKDFSLLKELMGHDYTFLDQFNIPLIVSVGGENLGEVYENVGSQIDLMPTVANLVGISLENHVHFGQDIVNYPENLFGIRYYMPVGSFFNNEIAFRPAEGFEDGEAFDLTSGVGVEDFSSYLEDYNRILELLELSDEYMNSLPFN